LHWIFEFSKPNVDTKSQLAGPREIELGPGADGVLLSLAVEQREEFTADGRSDRGQSGYPILAGVHQVSG